MTNQSPEREANTVSDTAASARQSKAIRQRWVLIAIATVVVLMLITLLVLAIGAIVQVAKDNNNKKDPIKDGDIIYEAMTVTDADAKFGALVIVNKDIAYTFPETEEHLDEIYTYDLTNLGLSQWMAKEALEALTELCSAYAKDNGVDHLAIRYAYRTYDEQAGLESPFAAGHTDLHTGFACELRIKEPGATTNQPLTDDARAWLAENGAKYGFVLRYPEGKADLTKVEDFSDFSDYIHYVGVPHATLMVENDLCMEEYPDYLKEHATDGLTVKGADGNSYKIYYYDVNGETEIEVPTNCGYTLSGTNTGGIVVTVDPSDHIETEADESTSESTTVDTED